MRRARTCRARSDSRRWAPLRSPVKANPRSRADGRPLDREARNRTSAHTVPTIADARGGAGERRSSRVAGSPLVRARQQWARTRLRADTARFRTLRFAFHGDVRARSCEWFLDEQCRSTTPVSRIALEPMPRALSFAFVHTRSGPLFHMKIIFSLLLTAVLVALPLACKSSHNS